MQVFSVTQFVAYLNDTFKAIWDSSQAVVEGEVSNYRVSQGQWVNFDVKDDESLVSCFMVLNKLRLPLEDGMRVRLTGYPRVYPKYGKFSFNVDRVDLVGEGALRKALAALHKKLEAEGLFDLERKRQLPRFPQNIALIASRDSAAYGDFIRIINERWSGLNIDLYHAVVQGEKAPDSVISCLTAAHRNGPYDAVVITRGGGSFDELMAFNDERLVRAIFASKIPTMVAIGHERDISMAEEAADIRGSTPTDCARRLVPDKRDVLFEISQMQDVILTSLEFRIDHGNRLIERATIGAERWMEKIRLHIDALLRLVSSFNPNAVLKRGYAFVTDDEGGIISTVKKAKAGSTVSVRVQDGSFDARVEGKQGSLI